MLQNTFFQIVGLADVSFIRNLGMNHINEKRQFLPLKKWLLMRDLNPPVRLQRTADRPPIRRGQFMDCLVCIPQAD
jgi:hypothetical protein